MNLQFLLDDLQQIVVQQRRAVVVVPQDKSNQLLAIEFELLAVQVQAGQPRVQQAGRVKRRMAALKEDTLVDQRGDELWTVL